MQFTVAAVIVEPVGQIDILLDLDQRQPAADGMDGAGRRIDEVAGFDRLPVEQMLDRAVQRSSAQFVLAHRLFGAERDGRAGLSGKDQPRLVLAARIARALRLGVGGVDLHRQMLAGEQIFDEKFGIAVTRRLEPHFADRRRIRRRISETGPQIAAPPGLFDATGGEQRGGHGDSSLPISRGSITTTPCHRYPIPTFSARSSTNGDCSACSASAKDLVHA